MSTHPIRQNILHHIFCTSGSGWQWRGGDLVTIGYSGYGWRKVSGKGLEYEIDRSSRLHYLLYDRPFKLYDDGCAGIIQIEKNPRAPERRLPKRVNRAVRPYILEHMHWLLNQDVPLRSKLHFQEVIERVEAME